MTVVVGYIPTPEGRAALELAIREAVLREQSLLVVNIHRDESFSDERLVDETDLDHLRTHLDEAGITSQIRTVHSAAVSDALIQAADEHAATMVVIGVRHRSAVGKPFLGSNALEVIMKAHCPVLTVRAAETAPE